MKPVYLTLSLLLAGCPKGSASDPRSGGSDPSAIEPVPVAELPGDPVVVSNPEIVCRDPDHELTSFLLELTYPEGCPVIPSEFGGEIHDLEIEIVGTPPEPLLLDSVELGIKDFTWASAGCGARIRFEGAIGTLDVNFAANDSEDAAAAGTGTWTPSSSPTSDDAP